MLYRLRALIRNLLFRKQLEARLDDEIESAVEILAAEYVRDGIDPKDARRRAQIELGGREQVREYVRQGRSGAMIEEVVRDLRVTTRSLRRSPAFSLVTLLVIAVTIAGTSTVFTLVDSVLLEPLPFPNSRRLVVVTQRNSDEGELPGRGFRSAVSWPDFLDIRSESRSFEALAGFRSTIRELDPFGPERYIVSLRATSASLFEVIPTVPTPGAPPDSWRRAAGEQSPHAS
jgi:hypothetical protein